MSPGAKRGRWLAGRGILLLAVLLFGAWGALALWYQGGAWRIPLVAGWLAWLLFLLWTMRGKMRRAIMLCLLSFAGLLLWWWSLQPRLDRVWAADVAHIVSGEVDGSVVTLDNVRDFEWRSETDFTPRWSQEQYNLAEITGADVVLSYWGIDAIAHTLVSFGFEDGRRVVFSVEIRREEDESFSSVAGFFKDYELSLIASQERDILFLRTNVRGEDTYLYPLDLPREALQALFLHYVETGRELSRQAQWYNTLTANCTTVVFDLARLIEPGIPMDWRILLSGYLPGYLIDQGVLAWDVPEAEARRRAAISARANAAPSGIPYSSAIRATP
jgi:hypothetical protein